MRIETERIIITEFDLSMAESVHKNSLDEDNRQFVPDEVFETVEEAKETIEKAPIIIPNGLTKEEAEKIVSGFVKNGFQASIIIADA